MQVPFQVFIQPVLKIHDQDAHFSHLNFIRLMQISAVGKELIILCNYRDCHHITRAVKPTKFKN